MSNQIEFGKHDGQVHWHALGWVGVDRFMDLQSLLDSCVQAGSLPELFRPEAVAADKVSDVLCWCNGTPPCR